MRLFLAACPLKFMIILFISMLEITLVTVLGVLTGTVFFRKESAVRIRPITNHIFYFLVLTFLHGCKIGAQKTESDVKIFGGTVVKRSDFPAAVDLWTKTSNLQGPPYLQTCSGSFIHPRVVLTAAHCIGLDSDSTNSDPKSVSHVLVNGNLNFDVSESALQLSAQKDKSTVIAHLEASSKEAESVNVDFGKQVRAHLNKLIAKLNAKTILNRDELRFVASALVAKSGWKPIDGKVYPGYGLKPRGVTPDVGLLLLPADVKSSFVRYTNTPLKPGEKLEFVGFGFQNSQDLDASSVGTAMLPRPLKMAENSPIVDAAKSNKYESNVDWNFYFASLFDPKLFAANQKYGLGCRGDSGGPVYRRFKTEIAVVGVTSRIGDVVNAQGLPAECEKAPFAMIYNRLDNSQTQKWINATMKAWGL